MFNQTVQQLNNCQHCALSDVCLASSVQQPANCANPSHRVYHRGDPLFSMGDQFDALYILRAGSAKSFLSSSHGDEQITGFYHPGDLIGADGFDSMTYAQSLTFLETSSVCRINLSELNRAMAESPKMLQRLLQSMSHSLVGEQQMVLSVSKLSAEQRLAKFFLDLSARFKLRGLSDTVFDLSMTRIDMANYLGMAIETISRLLGKLQAQGIIDVNRRQITLLNIGRLQDCLSDIEDGQWYPAPQVQSKVAKPQHVKLSA